MQHSLRHTAVLVCPAANCVLSAELFVSNVKVRYGGYLCLRSCIYHYDCAHRPLPKPKKNEVQKSFRVDNLGKHTPQKFLRRDVHFKADQRQHQRMFLHPYVKTISCIAKAGQTATALPGCPALLSGACHLCQPHVADDISQHFKLPEVHDNSNFGHHQPDLLPLTNLCFASRLGVGLLGW